MVLEKLTQILADQYGCDPEEVSLRSTLDELNLTADDMSDLSILFEELYGVTIPDEALAQMTTVEDFVGYIEDNEA